MSLFDSLKVLQIPPKGVVYVGAHHGEEVDKLLAEGFNRIHLVEANPSCFSILMKKFGGVAGITLSNSLISDAVGSATFNLASFDQSSSLLNMKHHSNLYRNIKEIDKLVLQTQTLKSMLELENIDSSAFNLLCIDVQGAELRVLRGAESVLPNLDAVICEVNAFELYEDCALVEEIDSYLFDFGFVRHRSSWQKAGFWGDALYVKSALLEGAGDLDPIRRGVLAMPNLGKNGRFGNQLFQLAFLIAYAARAGCKIAVPSWKFASLFKNLPQMEAVGSYPRMNLKPKRLSHLDFFDIPQMPRDLVISGYFQALHPKLRLHQRFMLKSFDFNDQVKASIADWKSSITRGGASRLVVAHLRYGDYTPYEPGDQTTGFPRIPSEWLREELVRLRTSDPHCVIILATDDDQLRKEFQTEFGNWSPPAGLSPEIADFCAMTKADTLLVANSSFSHFAALLADQTSEILRIDFKSGKYVTFDPWKEKDFWESYRGVEEASPENEASSAEERIKMQTIAADRDWAKSQTGKYILTKQWLISVFKIYSLRLKDARGNKRRRDVIFSSLQREIKEYWKKIRSNKNIDGIPRHRIFSNSVLNVSSNKKP